MSEFMSNLIKGTEPYESLYKLNIGHSLDEFCTYEAMTKILHEKNTQKRISLMNILLNGIMVKGASVSEIEGLLKASFDMDNIIEDNKPRIVLPKGEKLIGCAGSGKKGVKTINITTPSAILASACGVYIAKACSHSTSSKTGSSDFLSMIGIDINIEYEEKLKILEKNKIIFFSIESTTPKFAEVYGGVFYAPHAMSFGLAGLSFPVKLDCLAYGLSHPNVKLSADIFKRFGLDNVMVYSSTEDGLHYLDELSISGRSNVIGIKDGVVGRQVMVNIKQELNLNPKYSINDIADLPNKYKNVAAPLKALLGKGKQSYIDSVCVNAALFISLSGKSKSLKEGFEMAKACIKSGNAFKHLLEIVELYGGNSNRIYDLIGGKYGS